MAEKEYGVRWQEFDSRNQMVTKEKFFETREQLNDFYVVLVRQDNFVQVLEYIEPKDFRRTE